MVSRIAPTIPSRLARAAKTSKNWDEARARARSLYRLWHRAAPEICSLYELNLQPSAVRAKTRQNFERYAGINDLEAMDVLLHKNYVEYQEAVNCWKMESHVMRWFDQEEMPAKPENFLDEFYHGRDEPKLVREAS